ncbi:hypothetical protein [Pseudomonas fluorescens]
MIRWTVRLIAPRPQQAGSSVFYCKTRLANEIQGAVHRSIFQHDDQLLAQQLRQNGKIDTTLLATDQQRSVINALDAAEPHPLAPHPTATALRKTAICVLRGDPVNRSDPNGKYSILSNVFSIFNASAVVAVGTFAGSLYVEDETLGLILSGISGLAGGIALGSKLAPLRKARQPQMSGSVQPRGNTSITIQMNSLPQGNPSSPPAYNPPAPVDRGLNRFSQRPPAFRTEARDPNLPQHRLGEQPNGSPVFEGPNGTPTTRPSGASDLAPVGNSIRTRSR